MDATLEELAALGAIFTEEEVKWKKRESDGQYSVKLFVGEELVLTLELGST